MTVAGGLRELPPLGDLRGHLQPPPPSPSCLPAAAAMARRMQACWWGCTLHVRQTRRGDALNPTPKPMPPRIRALKKWQATHFKFVLNTHRGRRAGPHMHAARPPRSEAWQFNAEGGD